MSQPKRPKLNAVFKRPDPTGEVETPTTSSVPDQAVKMVQLNVTVPEALRRTARIKAIQEGRDLTSVVRDLLNKWVGD